jgi:hypothetical protein
MSIRAIAGPTPRRYQSGETDIWGGSADAAASWRAPRSHEVTLYKAAHSLLTRSQKRPALRAWGMKIANRRGMAKARIWERKHRRQSEPGAEAGPTPIREDAKFGRRPGFL